MPRLSKDAAEKILTDKVNKLARLNAVIAKAKEEAEAIKEELKATGREEILTPKYRCVIVNAKGKESLDTKMVRQYLTTEQLVECTVYGKPYKTVSLYDR